MFTRMVRGIKSGAEEFMLYVSIFSWKVRYPLAVVSEFCTILAFDEATCI